ncbi:MAG: hypothetical protein AB1491_13950 [Thermodesulfobacteriota bacterium]
MAGAGKTASQELARIQQLFRDLGLWEQKRTLDYQGEKYLVYCDAQAFSVYRLVERCHVPPGRPGWPVLLVTAEAIIDESSPPVVKEDEFSSGLTLEDWLHLIETYFR